jgi:hypothetical protein
MMWRGNTLTDEIFCILFTHERKTAMEPKNKEILPGSDDGV